MPRSAPENAAKHPAKDPAATARIVRRVIAQWPLVVALALVAAVLAYGASSRQTKEYEATSIMQVGSVDLVSLFLSQDIQVADTDPQRQTAGSVEIFNLPNVRDRAVEALGPGYTADQVGAAITINTSPNTSVLRVVARDTDPLRAQAISVAMTDAFVAQRIATQKRALIKAKRQVRRSYNELSPADKESATGLELQDRLRQVGVIGSLVNGNAEVIQKARVPTTAVAPRPKKMGVFGLLLGGLVGLLTAILRARLDDRVRDLDELAEIWDLPVVGTVPQTSGLRKSGRTVPDGPALEALSLARTNLRYLHVGGSVKTVLVTSALAGEGKSTITTNLAIAAGLAGSRVLVVEGDLRRPTIAARLGLTGSTNGFSEVLAGIATLDQAISTISVGDEDGRVSTKLDLLPAGLVPPSPVALLESPATKEVFATLRARYDVILIDTPPAIVVADALTLTDEVDGVLVVSRLGTVKRSSLLRLRDTLIGVDAPVLGQIVNSGADDKSYEAYTDPGRTAARWWQVWKRPGEAKA